MKPRHAPQRWFALLLALMMSAACFQPTYQEGIRCSEAHTCPPGLTCDLATDICRAADSDAGAPPDAPIDAAPTACELEPERCGNGTCVAQPDGYTCSCDPGYEFDGTRCALITYGIVGAGTEDAPRTFADGYQAASCLEYLQPALPYVYEGDTGDGFYVIDTAGQAVTLYCDMTTDGGGWTRVVHWDRQSDPGTHTLATLLAALVDEIAEANDPEVSPMGWLADAADHITWADVDASYDALALRRDVAIPNQGELRLDVHYFGYSMEDSAIWIYAATDREPRDLHCWSDAEGTAGYTAAELALIPYACSNATGTTFRWDAVQQYPAGAPVTALHLRSLHADRDADRSDLYRFTALVR